MNVPHNLLLFISLTTSIVAILFLFFPGLIEKLEEKLNAPWGGQTIASIRLGLPGEKRIEEVLNKPVLEKHLISWDGWLQKHPRLTGSILGLLSLLCWWLTLAN